MQTLRLLSMLMMSVSLTGQVQSCEDNVDIFPCTCSLLHDGGQDKIKVDCSGQHLTSVPSNFPRKTAILDFSDNSLRTKHLPSLCSYLYLEHVSVANNNLGHIEPKSLRLCESPKTVNFSGNVLDVVSSDTFNGLEFSLAFYGVEALEFQERSFSKTLFLQELHLTMYQSKIPANLFERSNLIKLSLHVNGAKEIPATIIQPLADTLRSFCLKSSLLQSVDSSLFLGLKSLKEVQIHLTEIPESLFQHDYLRETLEDLTVLGTKTLEPGLFAGLTSLRYLFISYAKNLPVGLFSGLFGLIRLHLSECVVSSLEEAWFRNLKRLDVLIIQKAGLSNITAEAFTPFEHLQLLDLSRNAIKFLPAQVFYEISDTALSINLSYNNIKTFNKGLFNQGTVLETLDLSSNQIYSIEVCAFNSLLQLRNLYLQNNKIYSIEAETFVNNLNMAILNMASNKFIDLPSELFNSTHNLLEFDLSDNRISELEKSIDMNVPSLSVIKLCNNPILCDCEMVSLKQRLSHVELIGDCVNLKPWTTILDFILETNCSTKQQELNDTDTFAKSSTGHELRSLDVKPNNYSSSLRLEPSSPTSTSFSTHTVLVHVESIENITKLDVLRTETNYVHETSLFPGIIQTSATVSVNLFQTELLLSNASSTDTVIGTEFTIQPTPAFTETPEDVDNKTMTDEGLDTNGEIPEMEPPNLDVGDNLTGVTEAGKTANLRETDYFYISLACIISVSVISVAILVFLYYKRRNNNNFIVTVDTELKTDYSPIASPYSTVKPKLAPLKEVPSIQIESLDEDGNVQVELYPLSQDDDTRKT